MQNYDQVTIENMFREMGLGTQEQRDRFLKLGRVNATQQESQSFEMTNVGRKEILDSPNAELAPAAYRDQGQR